MNQARITRIHLNLLPRDQLARVSALQLLTIDNAIFCQCDNFCSVVVFRACMFFLLACDIDKFLCVTFPSPFFVKNAFACQGRSYLHEHPHGLP